MKCFKLFIESIELQLLEEAKLNQEIFFLNDKHDYTWTDFSMYKTDQEIPRHSIIKNDRVWINFFDWELHKPFFSDITLLAQEVETIKNENTNFLDFYNHMKEYCNHHLPNIKNFSQAMLYMFNKLKSKKYIENVKDLMELIVYSNNKFAHMPILKTKEKIRNLMTLNDVTPNFIIFDIDKLKPELIHLQEFNTYHQNLYMIKSFLLDVNYHPLFNPIVSAHVKSFSELIDKLLQKMKPLKLADDKLDVLQLMLDGKNQYAEFQDRTLNLHQTFLSTISILVSMPQLLIYHQGDIDWNFINKEIKAHANDNPHPWHNDQILQTKFLDLNDMYDQFNKEFFNNELPKIPVRYYHETNSKQAGFTTSTIIKDNNKKYRIPVNIYINAFIPFIDPNDPPPPNIIKFFYSYLILLHEMIHVYVLNKIPTMKIDKIESSNLKSHQHDLFKDKRYQIAKKANIHFDDLFAYDYTAKSFRKLQAKHYNKIP